MGLRQSVDSQATGVGAAVVGALLVMLTTAPTEANAQARTTSQRQQAPAAPVATFPATSFTGLKFRAVGPQGPGGALTVSGSSQRPLEYFAGSAGGGLWKTTDAGLSWRAVTDGQIRGSTVAAVAVAPSHADTLYLGSGDWDAKHGNTGYGVYRSVDAGKTWTHVGLEGTRAISRIVVHPTDAATVYAAAIGSPHATHRERGVFRSFDAGKTWQLVLSLGDSLGAYEIALSKRNPQLVFASFWDPAAAGGRSASRLFRSADGGDSWKEVTTLLGSAPSTRGRIAVSVSPVDSQLVFVALESDRVQLLVSRDGGESFEAASRNRLARGSDLRIYADVADAARIYVINGGVWRSDNSGSTLRQAFESARSVHDFWQAPENPRRSVVAGANGTAFTQNGGAALALRPLPTLRLTSVVYAEPASMVSCAGILTGPTLCTRLNAPNDTGTAARGNSESLLVSTRDSLTLYGMSAGRLSIFTVAGSGGALRSVRSAPRSESWHSPTPLAVSTSGALYTASNRVWRSDDGGSRWRPVSGILTGASMTQYISSLAASHFDSSTIWAATSDGQLHLTRDGGKSWKSTGPTSLAQNTEFVSLYASPHDANTLYASARRTRSGDPAPYVWKTSDYGATWTRADDGIPDDDAVRTLVEDRVRRGLLWAGTDRGVFVSFNQGGKWQELTLGMPEVPITGIAMAPRAVILATDGRGLWMLDDATPVRAMTQDVAKAAVHLFDPPQMAEGSSLAVYYHLARPADSVVVDITDSNGKQLSHFASYRRDSALVAPPGAPTRAVGLNHFVWNGRTSSTASNDSTNATPGRYTVRIAANGSVDSASVEIVQPAAPSKDTNRSLPNAPGLAFGERSRHAHLRETKP